MLFCTAWLTTAVMSSDVQHALAQCAVVNTVQDEHFSDSVHLESKKKRTAMSRRPTGVDWKVDHGLLAKSNPRDLQPGDQKQLFQ